MTITNVRTGPVREALTLQYDQVLFILEPSEQAKTANLSIVAARRRAGAISRTLISFL
jgi:hypothetical protein